MKIPAIKGKIGDTVYYTANLTFQQVNQLIKKVDQELHTSTSLREEIQRSLSDNYIKIKQYILNDPEHFFNALVLAVYDGQPIWTEIRYELEDEWYHNVGVLHFNGEENIFPVDGQHRVEGIKAALKERPELASETVSVILIGHSTTPIGMRKSRKIFSTLNRYAKPVRLGDIIALDEDDIVAIATREMLETYPLFQGDRMKATNTKSIPTNDKSSFTSLITLYECHLELFQLYFYGTTVTANKVKTILKKRPDDNTISSFISYLIVFWDSFQSSFTELHEYLSRETATAANDYRDMQTGGNIIFRPVSLLQMIKAIAYVKTVNHNISTLDILSRYNAIDRNVSSGLWTNIIWNANTKKMIVNNQILLKYLFVYIYDKAILRQKHLEEFYQKYAFVKNISIDIVDEELRQYLPNA